MKFYEQLEKHYNAQYEEESYIKPHHDWELDDYKDLHYYIQQGWIVDNCDSSYINDTYIINPEWDDEHLWTPPKKIKFKIITKEEKVRRGIMKIRKQHEENERKKFTKVLEDCSNGVDIREATIKNVGQNFQNKVDKLLDKLEVEDTLRDYFV